MPATDTDVSPHSDPAAPWDEQVDLLVLGTGAGGLSAAVTGAHEGLSVLVLEKTEFLGGTTAYSAGTCWIPDNHFQRAAGVTDDAQVAAGYLDRLVGDKAPRELRESYLRNGRRAVDYFDRIGVRFWHSRTVVDYHPEIEGASLGGRALEPQTFDGRILGRENFGRVRPPVPEFALFGGTMMVRRAEVNQLLTLLEGSPKALPLALRLGARWARDRLTYRRGTRLAMGNALVAALFHRLLERDGRVWFHATATRLETGPDGRVVGAVVAYGGRELRVRARRGVVLAGGGFAAGPRWRSEHLPHLTPQYTRAAEGSTGDTLSLGQSVGGALSAPQDDNAFWFPSSVARRKDGSVAVFPHIWDRSKPGIVAVDAAGRRFVDESVSYHRFVRAMYAADAIPAWLVIDSRSLHRYGLGMIRPHLPRPLLRKYLARGYLHTAPTIGELAARIGVDTAGLARTVAENNRAAATGVDTGFGKGTSPFGLQYGDPGHRPNPSLGPIERAPFYAIAVLPTPLGTALGLRTDGDAQVLDAAGTPIPGLYACGNDAASMSAAEYPGAGCQVGGGLTFGWVAARHAAAASPSIALAAPTTAATPAATTAPPADRTRRPLTSVETP
ncbi:FAD-binding protein [Nakamurella sp.]|uniref:FAD-binding protein n=1 Tax=Nakamurella sp. TaxID=1869182 RepID=UPI003B3ADB6C